MKTNVTGAKAERSGSVADADHQAMAATARKGQTTARLGLLEGVVDRDSIPDFLEPLDANEMAAWNGDAVETEVKTDDRVAGGPK